MVVAWCVNVIPSFFYMYIRPLHNLQELVCHYLLEIGKLRNTRPCYSVPFKGLNGKITLRMLTLDG